MNATPTNNLSSPVVSAASNGPSRPPAHCGTSPVPNLVASNATPISGATPPVERGIRPNSENSDRNNNATPPTPSRGQSIPPVPPPLAIPNARRASQQQGSPPVGARPNKHDLPPGAAPLGSIPRPPQPPSSNSSAVPLLASQLGRPVNLGERGHHQTPPGAPGGPGGPGGHMGQHGPGVPPLSPHHLNMLAHSLSPFAAIPMGNGKFMARNINGTCK